jgi:hypothetical protein
MSAREGRVGGGGKGKDIDDMSRFAGDEADEVIAVLREALRTIRYGSLEFIIHDGRVLQIDRKEKLRLQSPADDRRPNKGS